MVRSSSIRRVGLPLGLLIFALAVTGCMVSEQEGERRHYNLPFPDSITFHFDTSFNRTILGLRALALFVVPVVVFLGRRPGSWIVPSLVTVATIALAGWWYYASWNKVDGYRIEVRPEHLRVRLPGEEPFTARWERIYGIDVEGRAIDVRIPGAESGLDWAPEWEDLTILLSDGKEIPLDLRPLSVEQRGVLCQAIERHANLSGETVFHPAPGRR